MNLRNIAQAAALAASALLAAQAGAANLITNGDFEDSTSLGGNPSVGGLGQIDSIVTATGWSNSNPSNFNFILDTTADDNIGPSLTGGFTSVNSQAFSTNIFVWGPGNGGNAGFTGSTNGGKFLGGDGGYATGPVTQTVSGLTVGVQYELSFEWAGAQFTDQSGDYWVGWDVSFGGESFSVGGPGTVVASHGFKPWETVTHTFTATSASQVLTFLATGPTGLPPFSLLDGVSLTPPGSPPPPPVPEPESLALMLAGAAVLVAKRRRDAKRAA